MGTHRIGRDGRIVSTEAYEADRAARRAFRFSPQWRRIRAEMIAASPHCSNPECSSPITRANPLSLDHRTPLSAGERSSTHGTWRCCAAAATHGKVTRERGYRGGRGRIERRPDGLVSPRLPARKTESVYK